MQVKVQYSKQQKTLKRRKCQVCGREFYAYNNGKNICSKECKRAYDRQVWANKKDRLRADPVATYRHRKATIEKREAKRKAEIRKDLPAIKKALKQGDECLVDYLFDNYGAIRRKRLYRKD